MSFIRSGDATIYYEEYGTGDPLILLPGLLGTIETTWRRFVPDFSALFHTVVVDLRGHGRTNNPSGVLQLEALSNDLLALIETLGLGKAMVCGYSLGGYIGLHHAIRHPGHCARLVMHATRFFWNTDVAREMERDLDAVALRQRSPHTAGRLQREHSPGNGPDGWSSLSRAAKGLVRDLATRGLTQEMLALVDIPVLVTAGEQDVTVPGSEAERLARALPGGSVRTIPGASHPIGTVPTAVFLHEVVPFLTGRDNEP